MKHSSGNSPEWPGGWSHPSPVFVDDFFGGRYMSGGIVWIKQRPATDDDVEALERFFASVGRSVSVDEASLVGKADSSYTTFYLENKKQRSVF